MKNVLIMSAAFAALAAPTMAADWSGNYVGGSVNTAVNTAGAFVGRNFDLGRVVLGVEGGASHNFRAKTTGLTVEGVVGIDVGKVMPYVSGGWSYAGTQVYGGGLAYQVNPKTTVGIKWSTTGSTSQVTGRVALKF